MTKELLRMPVYCPNRQHKCDVIVKWSDLSQHLTSCSYAHEECPNPGCHQRVPRSCLQNHQKSCDFQLVPCELCCERVPQKSIAEHQKTCTPKPRKCTYHELGCTFEGLPDAVKEHHCDYSAEHTAEHVAKTMQLSKEQQSLQSEIDKLMVQLQELKETAILAPTSNTPVLQSLQKSLAKASENVTLLSADLSNKVDREEIKDVTSKVVALQDVSRMQETRITRLEQQGGTGGGGGARLSSDDSALQRLQRVESSSASVDVKLAEFDLRFRLLETASYSGRMTWKIGHYSRRKADAVAGRTLSLYSQPFYTSPCGYKMCARAYLNGDGMGKNTHLSLFFVVMRGEYDALVPWPFRQRVTLMLVDQSEAKRHVTDTFRADPTSTSFRRPVGEMNIASGSPLFAAHSVVESDKHLRDDTIFIRCLVDTTGLSDD